MNRTYTPARLPLKSLNWKQLAPLIGKAREHLARYDETIRPIPPPILEMLKWEESISSLRSQNIESDLKEILRFSLDGTANETRAPLLQKIINAKEALDFAIQWPLSKPLNAAFLCKIHAFIKKDAPNPNEIGRLRKRQNWIGAQGCPIEEAYFFPPKYHLLPGYLKNWSLYSNRKELDPLVQLAILLAQLLIIHPFMDGNGRTGRIYLPLFLMKKKLISQPYFFMSRYFESHRLNYFQKLFDISEENDWEDWILYFLNGVVEQAIYLKCQAENLKRLYAKIKRTDLFVQPVRTLGSDFLLEKKILREDSAGLYWFEPLFKALL